MTLRRRGPPAQDAAPKTGPPATEADDDNMKAPKGRPARRPASSSSLTSRNRLLVLAASLIYGVFMITNRNRAIKPLPKRYAICSPKYREQILTLDANNSRKQCLVIEHGVISYTGSLEDVRDTYGDLDTRGKLHNGQQGIKIVFLRKGDYLMPGLIDAHAHVLQNGEAASAVDLVGSTSVKEAVDRIASFIERDPKLLQDRSQFILGLGWDQTKYSPLVFPTAADLEADPRLAGRPIYLKRIDVHALWVSQAIIEMIPQVPDSVPGGLVIRSPDGRPSGVFVDNAMSLVTAVIPPWTDEQRLGFLQTTAREMLDLGLTSVHDASLSLKDIAFLKKLDDQGRMPVRIYGLVSCEPLNSWCGDQVERYDGDKFQLRGVKMFCDGALGSWGAAMHEPYSDNPSERGIMISTPEEMNTVIKKWIDKGFQVASHGIGDRANTVILDAYEKALGPGTSATEQRLRIEHAQIMTKEDIARAGKMGVIASFQPTHATSDMAYAESRIGPERILGAYAWSSLKAAGSPLALGSDFPVERVSPWLGIYAATTRKWLNGDSPHGSGGWYPSERLSMLDTLRGFTTGAAYAAFQEAQLGSLEVGKLADFIVVDKDIFAVQDFEIPEMGVKATVLGGRLMRGRLQ